MAREPQDPPQRAGDRSRDRPGRADLFITCLVDFLFPQVGEAVVRVLRHLGVEVGFPGGQTCCGQPAFNAGYRAEARVLARHFLEVFAASEAVVTPSGSCASMVKEHYPELFAGDPALQERFRKLGERVWEFTRFLTAGLGLEKFPGRFDGSMAWHDSCHSLRSLGVREGPRRLLRSIAGLDLRELPGAEVCCGFGGLFAVKMPEISCAMLEDKVSAVEGCGSSCLAATDASCLMHIDGGLRRRGSAVRTAHVAEILAAALEGGRR